MYFSVLITGTLFFSRRSIMSIPKRPTMGLRVASQSFATFTESKTYDDISILFDKGEQPEAKVKVHALKYIPGWSDVKLSNIAVKDYSAFGGNLVFKVSSEGANPEAVALRINVGAVEGEENLPDARAGAIGLLLSKLELAPKKLSHGANWDIEVWVGGGVAKDFSHFDDVLAPQTELASLMGRLARRGGGSVRARQPPPTSRRCSAARSAHIPLTQPGRTHPVPRPHTSIHTLHRRCRAASRAAVQSTSTWRRGSRTLWRRSGGAR